ncbi:APC family permease [Neobacillus ginsengisoli]|uniref:Amino acid transporter n=1 Tax=Neobacillus ginsengisoli TaxID=904295 RepID=A0ABT9XUR0_9BACI|nr:APC family permease [Neobacillus ginsengisoli]MDQ0199309.1 amino acid transporter [Neobacillus ginsengisoli]
MTHPSHFIELFFAILALVGIWFSISNFSSVKRALIGRPMRTAELHAQHNKLIWYIALPILSADLYSSVAYGPESGITELVKLGNEAKWYIIPITISTVVLLFILIISYIMGILAYPNGGGAYAIAKDNFKQRWVSLIASGSLLVDYILTVAVSVSAALEAIVSAYPIVAPYETVLAILCVFILLMVNLRGIAESAKIFAWPTIGFAACMMILVFTGLFNEVKHGFVQPSTPPFGSVPKGLTILLILKAFSSACSALTGIETISNAVPIFRKPQQKNAIKTYIALGTITSITLLGFAYHLYVRGISPNPNNTMLSQLTEYYFGHGIMYQLIIWFTFIVLILAANSTFTGFSQLAAIVAADGFLPRGLTNRGDRLGYSNGIIVLAATASLLIIAFQAHTNALIPLYAIGVFMSFTVAQFGLMRRWKRVKGPHWKTKLTINTIGAIITTIVALIFAVTKFTSGAWIVLIVIPVLILFSLAIQHHYRDVAKELKIDLKTMRPEANRVITIVLVSGVHRVVQNTLSFATSICQENLLALYVGFDDDSMKKMEAKWEEWGNPCRLVTLKSKYRSVLEPLSRLIHLIEEKEQFKSQIHIVIPQFIPHKWWHNILHNQTALLLRLWLLRHRDVVITTVPYHLKN